MIKHDRCPWCGQRITAPKNPFKNAACRFCGKKYHTYFRYVFGVILVIPLLLMYVRYISIQLRLAILAVAVVVLFLLIPFARKNMLKKIREPSLSSVVEIPPIYAANVIAPKGRRIQLKKDDILLTDLQFDEADKSSVSPPIYVVWANKKSVRFYFLYDNEHTSRLLDRGSFDVWREVPDVLCTFEIMEDEQSDALSCMPFSNYAYKDIDESKIVGVDGRGITYIDERDVRQIVCFEDCTAYEKTGNIGESVVISELSCGVVLYTPELWTRVVFSERNRAQAIATPKPENRYARRDRLIYEIEKSGHKISRSKLL